MKLVEDLKNFALRGNVIDLVVGFTVGAAFTTIAKSLVDDIIMPPVGALMGNLDFADMYIVLKSGATPITSGMSPAAAKAAGAVTLNYGTFINNVIAFALVTLVMFFLISAIQKLDRKKPAAAAATTKPCPQCCTEIPLAAKRCPNCTSQLG
jgi:large conductance mechanosensitive channel